MANCCVFPYRGHLAAFVLVVLGVALQFYFPLNPQFINILFIQFVQSCVSWFVVYAVYKLWFGSYIDDVWDLTIQQAREQIRGGAHRDCCPVVIPICEPHRYELSADSETESDESDGESDETDHVDSSIDSSDSDDDDTDYTDGEDETETETETETDTDDNDDDDDVSESELESDHDGEIYVTPRKRKQRNIFAEFKEEAPKPVTPPSQSTYTDLVVPEEIVSKKEEQEEPSKEEAKPRTPPAAAAVDPDDIVITKPKKKKKSPKPNNAKEETKE